LCATVCAFLPVILIVIWLISSAPSHEDDERFAHKPAWTPAVATTPASADDEDGAAPAPAPAPSAPAPEKISKEAAKVLLGLIGIGVFGVIGLVYLPMATLANVVMGSP